MYLRDPLPDFPTMDQLRDWMAMYAPEIRHELAKRGICADDLAWPIQDCPALRIARASWQNSRPFPTSDEIVLLMTLLAPRDEEVTELDEQGENLVIAAVMVMSAPDAAAACIQLDLSRRRLALAC